MLNRKDRDYLEAMADRITAHDLERAELIATRDDAIRIALEGDGRPAELARIFGLSRARIYQIKERA